MEMIVLYFFGISSFTITGTDDLLVLILFFITFKDKFKEVIIGTFIGLITVMILSYFFARVLSYFDISSYIKVDIILAGVLGYIAFGLMKEGFSQDADKEEIRDLSTKTSIQVIIFSGVTYFLNGLDDFIVYAGFYLKYETLKENFFFSIGIISGVFMFAWIAQYAGNIFLSIEEKYQNKIKVMIGSLVLFTAVFLLFS